MSVAVFVMYLGLTALFLAGLHFVSGAAVRLVGPRFRGEFAGTGTGVAGKRFRAGLLFGAASGSAAAGVVQLVSLESRDPFWAILGIHAGAALLPAAVALVAPLPRLLEASLVVAALTIPLRAGVSFSHYTQGKVLTGVALMMLALALAGIVPPGEPLHVLPALPAGGVAGWFTGLVLAALLRSFLGPFVLAVLLYTQGWIPVNTAAMIIAGAIPGMTATGFLAARGLARGARRTAVYHLMCSGVAGAGALVLWWTTAGWWPVPPGMGGAAVVRLAFFPATVHLLVIPFLAPLHSRLAWLAARVVPEHPDEQDHPVHYLSPTLPESLDANLVLTRAALAVMAGRAYEMLLHVINTTQVDDGLQEATERLLELRSAVRLQEEQVSHVLTRSVQLPCSRPQAEQIHQQQRIAQELALIGDDCFKTMRLIDRSYRKQYRFHQESRDELFAFTAQILDFLTYIRQFLEGAIDRPDWDVANQMEDAIDRVRDRLKKRSRNVLEKHDDADIRGELTFIDIIAHLEHVGDRCLSIAEAVKSPRG